VGVSNVTRAPFDNQNFPAIMSLSAKQRKEAPNV
jgi:hypothetical protein